MLVVLLILAVIVIMAAALVLLGRTESRISRHYSAERALLRLKEALELYCISDVLLAERYFGAGDGGFRFYDPQAEFALTSASGPGDMPPGGLKKTDLLKDDGHLEQLLGEDGWIDAGSAFGKKFATAFPVAGEGSSGEGGAKARFILYFEDLGGARLDVNMTGNLVGGRHLETSGLTPFETRLGCFLLSDGVDNSGSALARIVDGRRYGYRPAHLEYPGTSPSYPYYPAVRQGNKSYGEYPYGPGDLFDCIVAGMSYEFDETPEWLKRYLETGFGSLLAEDLKANINVARSVTSTSASSIFADLVHDAEDENVKFPGSGKLLRWLVADDFPGTAPYDTPFSHSRSDLVLKRTLRAIAGGFDGDAEYGVMALAGFLNYLKSSEENFRIPGGVSSENIASNIWNKLDWVYRSDGIGRASGGVVPGTPYVAEVVAHRPFFVVLPPLPDADEPELDDLEKAKYIKVVNPWPPSVPSKAADLFVNGELIKSFQEGEVPSRGHFLLVADGSPHHNLPSSHYVSGALENLSYGDSIHMRSAVSGEVLWQADAGRFWQIMDYSLLPYSAQITDPRSAAHTWDSDSPTPILVPPIWQGVPIPVPKGPVIWIWFWNWFLSGWYWPGADTADIAWFNSNWQSGQGGEPAGGDGWHLLHDGNIGQINKNILGSFGLPEDETGRFFRSPADLTYVHSGTDWTTLNPSGFTSGGGEHDIAFLSGLSRYLIGNSPFEHGPDGQSIYSCDSHEGKLLGPPVRLHGRVNVNTAPVRVLEAVIPEKVINEEWGIEDAGYVISEIASAIAAERRSAGPFNNIDDLFNRVPQISGIGLIDAAFPDSPQRHAVARSLYNRITVRSDIWGVTGRLQVYEKNKTGSGIEVLAERAFYSVIDRSFLEPRVIFRTAIPVER